MPNYQTVEQQRFVNPYHFVPLDETCTREGGCASLEEPGVSGWIDCELETLTPLFIPNTSSCTAAEQDDDNRDKETASDYFGMRATDGSSINSYDFFSYSNLKGQQSSEPHETTSLPVLPGSSLRGVIRSVFETVTNSCLSTTDDEQVLYKRTTRAGKPGRLIKKDGEWHIHPCERHALPISNYKEDIAKTGERDKVCFNSSGRFKYIDSFPLGSSVGLMHRGEPFETKRCESVFEERTNKKAIHIGLEAVQNLLENVRLYRQARVNIHKRQQRHSGYKHFKADQLDDLDGALIYYSQHNGKYYLCPAAIGREVFHNRLRHLLGGNSPGSHAPCRDKEKLCPACLLFGMAGKDKHALASRVRFTDAKPVQPQVDWSDWYHQPSILLELAGPKPSATEFYLQKPDQADSWNYDYALTRKGKGKGKEEEIKNYKPRIQGRKFYWHQPNVSAPPDLSRNQDMDITDRNVGIRALKKGKRFAFRIYFNRLTHEEVNRLLWVTSFGGRSSTHAHKLGMGKPLGLGSVRIEAKAITQRTLCLENNSLSYKLSQKPVPDSDVAQTAPGCDAETLKALLKIADFSHAPNSVSYPYCVDSKGKRLPESYKWFVGNKQCDGCGTGTRHVISHALPHLTQPQLPVIVERD